MRMLRWTIATSIGATYVLIVLGALVRSTNSGLSCPDWPTCYGQWVITPADFRALGDVGYTYTQVMLEWVHRAIAGFVVGPLVLAVLVLAVARRRASPQMLRWCVLLTVLLLIQAKLGGLTVLDANSPWSVALHLGNALVLLAVMVRVFVATERAPTEHVSALPRTLAAAVWLTALATMITAAMTAKSGASLACYTWPDCNGAWLPGLDDPLIRLHFLHRALAAVTATLVVALLVVGWRVGDRRAGRAATAVAALVALQVLLGGLVIVLHVPIWTAVVHQATGVALFVLISYFLWLLRAAPQQARAAAGESHVRLQGA